MIWALDLHILLSAPEAYLWPTWDQCVAMCRKEQEVTTKVQHGAEGPKCGCGNAKRLLAAPRTWQRMATGLEKRLTEKCRGSS